MCKPQPNKSSTLLTTTLITLYTLGFLFFRIAELAPLIQLYPTQCTSCLVGTLVIQCSSTSIVGRGAKRVLYAATLLGLIFVMDVILPKSLPVPQERYHGKTVVITGGNSGVGYETARQLVVDYGMHVILGCRSKTKCDIAADAINRQVNDIANSRSSTGKATPMLIDLADLTSVQSFASKLQQQQPIYALFNNAGYAPHPNTPINQYGLDPSFTSMHLSHFLLTEELLKRYPQLRVVNTSSGTHYLCAIPFNLLRNHRLFQHFITAESFDQNPGCVDEHYLSHGIYRPTDTAAYITAKIANIMHAVELPFRHPEATSVAIDLGWVGTNIQNFMKSDSVWFTPTNLGWMRSVEIGVIPVMHAILSDEDELLAKDENYQLIENRTWTKEGGVLMGVYGRTYEAFMHNWFWSEEKGLGRSRMMDLSRGLWKASTDLIVRHVGGIESA